MSASQREHDGHGAEERAVLDVLGGRAVVERAQAEVDASVDDQSEALADGELDSRTRQGTEVDRLPLVEAAVVTRRRRREAAGLHRDVAPGLDRDLRTGEQGEAHVAVVGREPHREQDWDLEVGDVDGDRPRARPRARSAVRRVGEEGRARGAPYE